MPRVSRFKRRDSDRSGFTQWERQMVKEGPYLLAPEEFDTPPPSKLSLGGEGDINAGDMRSSSAFTLASTDTPTESENPTLYITAAGGIVPNTHPWMRIAGSNSAIDITANPQIAAGSERKVLTLECVGSSITLDHGTGLNLVGSVGFVMQSGAVISLIYTTGGSVWNETFRTGPR